jgi:type I restriction enzyme S subunit
MVGSTSRHINVKELKSLLIPVPKLEQQQEFERRAQAIFGVHSRTKGHLEKLGDLFTSLQHRAFRGEL